MKGKFADGFNSNQLKLIAIAAMTIDHVADIVCPYSTEGWVVLCHVIGRLTAPIMWFFIAEGCFYTRDIKAYAKRLFLFALISHFAYNFAFGNPFIPFKTSVFGQTSVIWPLAWGVIAVYVLNNEHMKKWMKYMLLILICVLTFCADWSCIAVMAIVSIADARGNFKKQMLSMMCWVGMYTIVYFFFIDKVYGIVQLFVALSIPCLKLYNGKRGEWKGMKWFFYVYYPLHLFLLGILRLLLYGNVNIAIGA